jgi:hypothetical protein
MVANEQYVVVRTFVGDIMEPLFGSVDPMTRSMSEAPSHHILKSKSTTTQEQEDRVDCWLWFQHQHHGHRLPTRHCYIPCSMHGYDFTLTAPNAAIAPAEVRIRTTTGRTDRTSRPGLCMVSDEQVMRRLTGGDQTVLPSMSGAPRDDAFGPLRAVSR